MKTQSAAPSFLPPAGRTLTAAADWPPGGRQGAGLRPDVVSIYRLDVVVIAVASLLASAKRRPSIEPDRPSRWKSWGNSSVENQSRGRKTQHAKVNVQQQRQQQQQKGIKRPASDRGVAFHGSRSAELDCYACRFIFFFVFVCFFLSSLFFLSLSSSVSFVPFQTPKPFLEQCGQRSRPRFRRMAAPALVSFAFFF